MGSPLGPFMANVFMDWLERKHRAKLTELGVNVWFRYVDDTFVVLKNKECSTKVFDYLNTLHPQIQFTKEEENNSRLPFLDVLVIRKEDELATKIYRKPTFTGVYLKWTSLTSIKYKLGLIYCLLDRAWKICSSPEARKTEISTIRSILAKNDYPTQIIDREIAKFMKNRSKESAANSATTSTTNTETTTATGSETTSTASESTPSLVEKQDEKKQAVLKPAVRKRPGRSVWQAPNQASPGPLPESRNESSVQSSTGDRTVLQLQRPAERKRKAVPSRVPH
jgi:hypothetical protein